jgi:hypothetical protein
MKWVVIITLLIVFSRIGFTQETVDDSNVIRVKKKELNRYIGPTSIHDLGWRPLGPCVLPSDEYFIFEFNPLIQHNLGTQNLGDGQNVTQVGLALNVYRSAFKLTEFDLQPELTFKYLFDASVNISGNNARFDQKSFGFALSRRCFNKFEYKLSLGFQYNAFNFKGNEINNNLRASNTSIIASFRPLLCQIYYPKFSFKVYGNIAYLYSGIMNIDDSSLIPHIGQLNNSSFNLGVNIVIGFLE